jgi:DNA repair exonuclease SbcCD ATPase subunit
MKLRRLRVNDFAGIVHADVEFGPGLNVLYGPNDLGKSTLADAIRSALLLPHGSNHAEQYVSWSGVQRPEVELTFQTEEQRIWRVRKQFARSGGFSLLQESRDGIDFGDVEKGRKVDGRIREILRWGIPEPGGSGSPKGMPESFLVTVLLSTQADVEAVLQQSLEEDPSGSGKERIAAALQAVAQDPLFLSLLRRTQARRDEAYTEKGAKKSSKDSPFRMAAELLRQLRDEKERWQSAVDESETVERELRDLSTKRALVEEGVSEKYERFLTMERLAKQTEDLRVADEQVQHAAQHVTRIQNLDRDIASTEESVQKLAELKESAEAAFKVAQDDLARATVALDAAQRVLDTVTGTTAGVDRVQHQALEIQIASADRAKTEAEHRLQAAAEALRKVDEARNAEAQHARVADELTKAEAALSEVTAKDEAARKEIEQFDLLERALALQSAESQMQGADSAAERLRSLRGRANALSSECEGLQARRSALALPSVGDVASMRRLETELAAARASLDVGLSVGIEPVRPVTTKIRKDDAAADSVSIRESIELEANTAIDIEIEGVAAVRIRGGKREAQGRARTLEARWAAEARPLLAAAGAVTLGDLDIRLAEGRALDAELSGKTAELAALDEQLAQSASAEKAQRQAAERVRACQAALADVRIEPLFVELSAFGSDAAAELRRKREAAAKAADAARLRVTEVRTMRDTTAERLRNSRAALETANAVRDEAVSGFPCHIAEVHATAQLEVEVANASRREAQGELVVLDKRVALERTNAEEALTVARSAAAAARSAATTTQEAVTRSVAAHSVQVGRLEELRRVRAQENLPAAEAALRIAKDCRTALPVPERQVAADEIAAAGHALDRARADLMHVEREIQKSHGALEQVGGGVARERLSDLTEAYEVAERQEREVEIDCEAWRLLLEQMKVADAEQASNLGQVLGPAVAGRFEALTCRRYDGVRLNAALRMEGVLMRGELRPTARISVGTREQLSTLYRLALAEYLQSTVVLDDQLVQSDEIRMDWFRSLLAHEARSFQIVVFTCRPSDYLPADGVVPDGGGQFVGNDSDGWCTRAIDLELAIRAATARRQP